MQPLDRKLDVLGLGVAAAAATWVCVVGLATGSRPASLAALLFASGATAVATRRAPRSLNLPILVLVAAAPLIVAALAQRPLINIGPLSGPLGYSNASGALFFISAGAAFAVGRGANRATVRSTAYIVAAAWILIPWYSEALAAALLGTILPLAVVFLRRSASIRVALLAGVGLNVSGIVATTAIGRAYQQDTDVGLVVGLAQATLTERRVALWSDAVDLLRSEPLTGVGPGRFSSLSPTALSDRDAQWAHNEYLEVAAETGLPGLILLVGLLFWGFAHLWTASECVRSVPALVVLTGAGLHANIDYVWHFPAVPIALAALVGASAGIELRSSFERRSQKDAVS